MYTDALIILSMTLASLILKMPLMMRLEQKSLKRWIQKSFGEVKAN